VTEIHSHSQNSSLVYLNADIFWLWSVIGKVRVVFLITKLYPWYAQHT